MNPATSLEVVVARHADRSCAIGSSCVPGDLHLGGEAQVPGRRKRKPSLKTTGPIGLKARAPRGYEEIDSRLQIQYYKMYGKQMRVVTSIYCIFNFGILNPIPSQTPRRNCPPHPPFGHLLPGGEKGTVAAFAEREQRGGGNKRSPSPRRGEGRGEGARAVALSEESREKPRNSPVRKGGVPRRMVWRINPPRDGKPSRSRPASRPGRWSTH